MTIDIYVEDGNGAEELFASEQEEQDVSFVVEESGLHQRPETTMSIDVGDDAVSVLPPSGVAHTYNGKDYLIYPEYREPIDGDVMKIGKQLTLEKPDGTREYDGMDLSRIVRHYVATCNTNGTPIPEKLARVILNSPDSTLFRYASAKHALTFRKAIHKGINYAGIAEGVLLGDLSESYAEHVKGQEHFLPHADCQKLAAHLKPLSAKYRQVVAKLGGIEETDRIKLYENPQETKPLALFTRK